MNIQILCHDCLQCKLLESNVKEVAKSLGLELELKKVEPYGKQLVGGMVGKPELIINGQVRSIGRVLSPQELLKMFIFISRAPR